MRTTIDIPDNLFRQAKSVASLKGISLKMFVAAAIENQVHGIGSQSSDHRRRVVFPLVPSSKPSSVELTTEKVNELLSDGDIHVLTRR